MYNTTEEYQQAYLKFMNIQRYDEKEVSIRMESINDIIHTNERFSSLMSSCATLMSSSDKSIGLALLLSYDYLDVFVEAYTLFISGDSKYIVTLSHLESMVNKALGPCKT